MPFAQNKRPDKKGIFNSNRKISISHLTYFKVCALNHTPLISPIYCEAKGNKILLWKQQPKSPRQKKKKKGKKALKAGSQV